MREFALRNTMLRRLLVAVAISASAVTVTACQSSDSNKSNGATQGATGKQNAAQHGNCPGHHKATVSDPGSTFHGQVTIDLCGTPKAKEAYVTTWAPLTTDASDTAPTNQINVHPTSCFQNVTSACHPYKDKVQAVCHMMGNNGSTTDYVAIILEDYFFKPFASHDARGNVVDKVNSMRQFTNAGDKPVGYTPAKNVKVSGLPQCGINLLHSGEARRMAAMQDPEIPFVGKF